MQASDRARKAADELLKGFSGDKPIVPTRADNTFLADVAADVERFGQFLKWSWKFHDFPCLIDEDGPLPIDLSGSSSAFGFMKGSAETPLYFLSESFQSLKFEGIFVGEIKDILRQRLIKFLTVRYSVDEDAPEPQFSTVGAARAGFTVGPTGYLLFQVRTSLPGLRIHYSRSYLGGWDNVFGAPTSPVDGWIRPGRYKFGGLKPDGTFLIDNANFDIPPLSAATLSF